MKVQKTIDYVLNLNREETENFFFRGRTMNYCALMKMKVVPALFLPMEGSRYIYPNDPKFIEKTKECLLTGIEWREVKNDLQNTIYVTLNDVELFVMHIYEDIDGEYIIYQNSRFQNIEDLAGLATFTEHAVKLYNI